MANRMRDAAKERFWRDSLNNFKTSRLPVRLIVLKPVISAVIVYEAAGIAAKADNRACSATA